MTDYEIAKGVKFRTYPTPNPSYFVDAIKKDWIVNELNIEVMKKLISDYEDWLQDFETYKKIRSETK